MEKLSIDLHKLFKGQWEDGSPATLVELYNADYKSLTEKAKDLRKLAVALVHSFERKPVNSASVALELLQHHHLPVRKGKWTTLVLNESRERHYVRDVKDDQAKLRLSHISSYKLPTAEILKKKVPLPKNGSYLIIFGGGPSIISDPEMLKLWKDLSSNFLVSDVIFWDDKDVSADFWSLGAGIGQKGNQILQFPNQSALAKWRNPIE